MEKLASLYAWRVQFVEWKFILTVSIELLSSKFSLMENDENI